MTTIFSAPGTASTQARPIAALGLTVNLLSVYLLRDHDHELGHSADDDGDGREHGGPHHHVVDQHDHHADHNFRAAYVHVLADVFTSILAISALTAGSYFGWVWLDPAAGLVGTCVISAWAYSLIKSSSAVLLDAVAGRSRAALIRERLEIDGDRVADLHLWRVGPGHLAVIAVIVTSRPRPPDHYKTLLASIDSLSHINIEVNAALEGPDQRAA
jgi:cation diffusion facilitator family transporter